MFAAVVFIGRRRIIALRLLQRRFLGEQIGVRHVAIEFGSGNVTRGGFGSFAHAFTSHFSGGG